jgi:hypothetical protein
VIAEECSHEAVKARSQGCDAALDSQLIAALADMLISVIGQSPLYCYQETLPNLRQLASDCNGLLYRYVDAGLIATSDIPAFSFEVDPTGLRSDMFSVDAAKRVVNELQLRNVRMTKKEFASFEPLRASLLSRIESWVASKEKYEIRTMASAAATLVALEAVPTKVGNVIKSIMNGIKVGFYPTSRVVPSNSGYSLKKVWSSRNVLLQHLLAWLTLGLPSSMLLFL